jgi:hypothetical protein
MSPFEQLLQNLSGTTFNPWVLVKLLFLLGLLVYVAFAAVVIRQVGIMNRTLNASFNTFLRLIAWIHLGVAVGIWLLAWRVL